MEETLNEWFVKIFRDILEIEEKSIKKKYSNMTINDMHVIEAIEPGAGKNMSTVARTLNVTMGTLTISINSLVKKGYVNRTRSEKDRRVVLVSLTEAGIGAYKYHQQFHEEMIQSVIDGLDESEQETLKCALEKLGSFFKNRRG
ncbi:MAG: winged helix DNA-binding protein [Lachnospiraceae bacterium]|nr:winged helix DNA-binding protein [Lachnospiraceae bacterium]